MMSLAGNVAHHPSMLAARFASLSKVEKDLRDTVHAMARVEGRPNQTDQRYVLARSETGF